MADGESTTEQWRTQLQNDLQNIFESFMTRWDKRLDEMFGRKEHDIAGKPERAKMSSSGSEVQTNDFNQVVKEIVTVVDVENGAQVLMDTKTAVVENPLPVKKPTKLEENGDLQVWLGDENSKSIERRTVIDHIHIHEISSKTSNVIDDYEKFDGIYSMTFVYKNVVVDDPYGFRLLVMGKRIDGTVEFGFKTCALELINKIYEKGGYPGEVLVVEKKEETIMDSLYPIYEPNHFVQIFLLLQLRYTYTKVLTQSTQGCPKKIDVVKKHLVTFEQFIESLVDATRNFSQQKFNTFIKVLPGLLGGNADLVSSNMTLLKMYGEFQKDTSEEHHVSFCVKEHVCESVVKLLMGMLIGLVTILNGSFERNKSRHETCYQIALTIKDGIGNVVKDLITVIQINVAALREGLLLRKSKQPFHLKWVVHSLGITNCDVQDLILIHTHMYHSHINDIIHSIINKNAIVIIENMRSDEKPLLVFYEEVQYTSRIDPGVYDTQFPRIPHTEGIYTSASITAMVTFHIFIIELMIMLQKMAEWICSLLKPADECEDPYLQLVYSSSWAMSVFYAYQHTWKLFDPIIGKANEMANHEGIAFMFEQVNHHPSMSVEQVEHFTYNVTSKLKTKFLGFFFDKYLVERTCVILKNNGELIMKKLITGNKVMLYFSTCDWVGTGHYAVEDIMLLTNLHH